MIDDKRYWDSDCFLAWLNEEPGKVDLCEAVLEEAAEGKIIIATSALTIAEVLKLRGEKKIPVEMEQEVIKFFKAEYIAIRNVTRLIAEQARALVWHNGIDPKDAIHVATALDARLPLFNTFDKNLLAKNGQVGSPPLRIEQPMVDEPKLQFDTSKK